MKVTVVLAFLLATLGCTSQKNSSAPQSQSQTASSPVPLPFDSTADDGQWVMPAKNYASTRFSALDQINTKRQPVESGVYVFHWSPSGT